MMKIAIEIDSGFSLIFGASVISGLTELSQAGIISLDIRFRRGNSQTLRLKFEHPSTKQEQLCALDFSDHSDKFDSAMLKAADVYFKRSLFRPQLSNLSPDERQKILSLGLIYPCASVVSRKHLARSWGFFALHHLPDFLQQREFTRKRSGNLTDYLTLSPPFNDANFPSRSDAPMVVFQTRLWDSQHPHPDYERVNFERVTLVRALRKYLKGRFIGGIPPTPYSLKHCPDIVLRGNYRRSDYLRLLRRCSIGVYSRGLHDSLAFKLPEYLGASLGIVSTPLRNELPVSLERNVNYLEFQTPEECVAQCERLIKSSEERLEMIRKNSQYYRETVAPGMHALSLLSRALNFLNLNSSITVSRAT